MAAQHAAIIRERQERFRAGFAEAWQERMKRPVTPPPGVAAAFRSELVRR